MDYIRRVITTTRDFYNDINSATLTGAIDVVIVKQPDGSYLCSPFHVRFGKIGVLRSREKVVDIEINGEPIDIHMKLGESGEAFFVQEVSKDNEEVIPLYLATSPLPEITDIGAEIQKMKLEVEFEERRTSLKSPQVDNDGEAPKTPRSVECIIVQSETDPVNSKTDLQESVLKTTDFVTIENEENNIPTIVKTRSGDDSPQTEVSIISTEDYEKTPAMSELELNVSGDGRVHVAANATAISLKELKDELFLDESKVKRKRKKKSMVKRKPRSREVETFASLERQRSDSRESGSTDQDQPSQPLKLETQRREVNSDEIFQMDMDDYPFENDQIPREELRAPNLVRSISMPLSMSVPAGEMSYSWRAKQLSATFAGEFHPFSDGDISPISSPMGSRPPSPKSDSEFERHKNDAVSQTDKDEVNWAWGELPYVPKNNSIQEWRKSSIRDDISTMATYEGQPAKSEGEVDKRSMLGGVLNFMRKGKKMHHMPQNEGIYLDDLNPNELDPEVAALYFPKFRTQYSRPHSNKDIMKEDDAESGTGTSLPQSPHSVEGAIGGPAYIDSDSDERQSFLEYRSRSNYNDIELSLCGGLQEHEGDVPEDRFLHFVITYDDLCDNPSMLQDPNLVLKMGGKYYNWQTAGPMLISLAIFERPLTEKAVGQLVRDYMPKKKKKSYSWWSWRKPPPTEANMKKDPQELMLGEEMNEKEERHMQSQNLEIVINNQNGKQTETILENRSNYVSRPIDSDTESADPERRPEKYKKSLTLSSEQIDSLNLQPGANEVEFSVTTAYQGTTRCKCNIYLWNYDDKIIISDIDGTITKSDVLGHILPIIGQDWAQLGVAQLFTKIKSNGYQFLYLSARAIGQARATKDYLRSIRQGDLCLPEGPLFLSPTSLINAFHREVIEKKPEVFKISCLTNIQALFPKPIVGNPFYAGFGNKINDTWAYRAVEIPTTRVFTINHKGELKLELIQTFQSSYTRLSDIVDQVFPPIQRQNFVGPEHFSSFTYWRMPLPTVSPSGSYNGSSLYLATNSSISSAPTISHADSFPKTTVAVNS